MDIILFLTFSLICQLIVFKFILNQHESCPEAIRKEERYAKWKCRSHGPLLKPWKVKNLSSFFSLLWSLGLEIFAKPLICESQSLIFLGTMSQPSKMSRAFSFFYVHRIKSCLVLWERVVVVIHKGTLVGGTLASVSCLIWLSMSDGRKSILFTSHYSLNGGLMQLGVSAEGKAQLVREQEKSTPNIIVVARELAFLFPP